jgi:hypothetical protein
MILVGLAGHVGISEAHRRAIMRNSGGDALDALIATVGAARAWHTADHGRIAGHPRYPREGRLYVWYFGPSGTGGVAKPEARVKR